MDANERRRRTLSEAAQWWVRLRSQDLSPLERSEFVDWLRESHIHVAEILRTAQVHGALEQFQRWAAISGAVAGSADDTNVVRLPVSVPSTHRTVRVRRAGLLALAAGSLAAVFLVGIVPWHVRGRVIETERGERRQVVLRDGSIAQVDPETRLRVKYAEHSRDVYLERGRVLFHVAKNAQRPFIVHSQDTAVRAVGTAFGVEQTGGTTIVTVADGKVAVSTDRMNRASDAVSPGTGPVHGTVGFANSRFQAGRSQHADEPGGDARMAWPAVGPEDAAGSPASTGNALVIRDGAAGQDRGGAIFLTANQQVMVESSGAALPVRAVDSQRELAWADGRLVFNSDKVASVVAEFNRYNRVQLMVTDRRLAERPVSGVFNAVDPEAFIAFLQSVTSIQVVRSSETQITIAAAGRAQK